MRLTIERLTPIQTEGVAKTCKTCKNMHIRVDWRLYRQMCDSEWRICVPSMQLVSCPVCVSCLHPTVLTLETDTIRPCNPVKAQSQEDNRWMLETADRSYLPINWVTGSDKETHL